MTPSFFIESVVENATLDWLHRNPCYTIAYGGELALGAVRPSRVRSPAMLEYRQRGSSEGEWMPTVLQVGPYRMFFYSNEGNEPPHIHVEAGDNEAKFWLAPVRTARPDGFSARELRKIARIVEEHQGELERAWHGYFGS